MRSPRAPLAIGLALAACHGCSSVMGMSAAPRDGGVVADATSDAAADAPADLGVPVVSLGPQLTVDTHDLLLEAGLAFGPDCTMGALPGAGDAYTFFIAGLCASAPHHEGTFRATGTLGALSSVDCTGLYFAGAAGAYGWSFDRDYAGGGPTVQVGDLLFMAYHGEMRWTSPDGGWCQFDNPAAVPCFYGSLGLALSRDGGVHFASVGQIISPYLPYSHFEGGTVNLTMGDGPMVIADGSGRPTADVAGPDAYVYVFFTDFDPAGPGACSHDDCLALARAPVASLVTAADVGSPAAIAGLFRKYDSTAAQVWGQPGCSGDPANETGSGHFSPLFSDEYANQASVVYDAQAGVYLVAYFYEGTIPVRASADLVHWSAPLAVLTPPAGAAVRYPTLLNTAQGVFLYFSMFNVGQPDASALLRVAVGVT